MEEAALGAVNSVGAAITEHCLSSFDADGNRLQIGKTTYCSNGQFPQTYKTPFGDVSLPRYVYKTAQGGKTFVPLEHKAHMVLNLTLRFAKMAASKMDNLSSTYVKTDLSDNHGVSVSRDYLTKLADKVG